MPSFNAGKLQDMLDRRSAAGAARRDLAERASDARSDRNRHLNNIRNAAASQGAQASAHIERLLAMPLSAAAALPKESITAFDRIVNGKVGDRWLTGVSYDLWSRYLLSAQQERRLTAQAEDARERFDAEFGIVDNLLRAVRGWGFNLEGN